MEKSRKVCYIVGAGDFCEGFSPEPEDLVIAADGGYAHLLAAGIRVDRLMGDFDSIGAVPDGVPLERFPPEKDDTDMMIAIKAALEMGFCRFALYGALGGRFDHTIANVQALCFLAGKGAVGYMVGNGVVMTAIRDGERSFPSSCEGYCSVFCMGNEAVGVDLVGLKYPLCDARLTYEVPLGVSNEFLGQVATVRVRKGTLLVVWYESAFWARNVFDLC